MPVGSNSNIQGWPLLIKRIAPVLCCSILLAMCTGCVVLVAGTAGAAAGVTTYAYISGELKTTEDVPLNTAWEAGRRAIDELQYKKIAEKKDATYGELQAQMADDRRVVIRFRRITDTSTQIRIRVGTFGDKHLSLLILEKIKSHIK